MTDCTYQHKLNQRIIICTNHETPCEYRKFYPHLNLCRKSQMDYTLKEPEPKTIEDKVDGVNK